MVYFLIAILFFFILLSYFSLLLRTILKSRNKVEECEYILRKAYKRRYDFILRLSTDNDRLSILRENALREIDLNEIERINKEITNVLESIQLTKEEKREEKESIEYILKCIDSYNLSVEYFNNKVFSYRYRMIARLCNVKRLDRVEI